MSKKFSYDEVPYPSFTFPQTRPDRLSSIGRFYGIDTAAPDDCSLLELGCGDGTNLLSFAYCHPKSRFVGIDLSEGHIKDALEAAETLGLKNVRFVHGDVTQLSSASLGKFDHIVAHGLFSWVPPAVRNHVLRIYSECLNANGIGYISYNAYPGFHLREVARAITRFHTADDDGVEVKVQKAIEILGFVLQALPEDSLNAQIIERELREMIERTPSNVFHDDLSSSNQAFYFHEFADLIGAHGMQFVSEADISSSNINGMSEEVIRAINAIGTDNVRREQYIDFIKFRRFRSSLVCSDKLSVDRAPGPAIVSSFRLSSSLKAAEDELGTTAAVTFTGDKDETVQLNHPLTKVMLGILGSEWTHSIAFDELLKRAKDRLRQHGVETHEADELTAQTYLLQMIRVELVRFSTFKPEAVTELSEKPRTSDFSRWQIARGCAAVTTMTGMNLEPENELVKAVISMADGTRSFDEIVEAVGELVSVQDEQSAEFKRNLPEIVTNCLHQLCSAGLMVG